MKKDRIFYLVIAVIGTIVTWFTWGSGMYVVSSLSFNIPNTSFPLSFLSGLWLGLWGFAWFWGPVFTVIGGVGIFNPHVAARMIHRLGRTK